MFTFWFNASTQRENLEEFAQQHTHSVTKSYFDSLNAMMLTGSINNREMIRERLIAEDEINDIRIIRSPALNKVFGSGLASEQIQDNLDQRGINGQTINEIRQTPNGRVLTRIEPILAQSNYQGVNCLGCHQVPENTQLGALRIDYSLASEDKALNKSLWTTGLVQLALFFIAFIFTAYILNRVVIARLRELRHVMSTIYQTSDLTIKLEDNREDEIGVVSSAFNQMVRQINDTLCSVVSNAQQVTQSAIDINSVANTTKKEVQAQKYNTDQMAAAMTEMAASAEQVKCNAEGTASHSQKTNTLATHGESQTHDAVSAIEGLSQEVQHGAMRIQQLDQRTDEVAAVLSVISGIAEQTNLLALNAAIEAARAGEQGRGFAVVADEVRTLASRTQESTEDIRRTIEGLKEETSDCVSVMNTASSLAKQQVASIQSVAVELKQISDAVNEICELNAQMETAAAEQSEVAESINNNVIEIANSTETTSKDAENTAEIAEHLLDMASQLEKSAKQFKLRL
ncbi:methyl-accepting chemotaxis protein [Parashewanella curva]|uniref:methyl-accepting chemotaxis protein n=1 Tax=Parashewanella curva TaxID=2338552 RepID=UPI001FB3CE6C|nr:methyl-accepting chemotaxis protein [Parashewanella curva]